MTWCGGDGPRQRRGPAVLRCVTVPSSQTEHDVSIVVLGAFNPAIFHPQWMAAQGLLGKGEAEAATVEIVHAEVAVFTGGWFRCEVTRDRFTLRSAQLSHVEPLRDLAVGCFRVLNHTPVQVCGVNHTSILRFESTTAFNEFGWTLVPPQPWDGALERPGVARLEEQGTQPGGRAGYIRVIVEPILDGSNSVRIEVNDHNPLAETGMSAATALEELLMNRWEEIEARARSITDRILAVAK